MGASNRHGQRGTTWMPRPKWATTPKLAVRRTVRTCIFTDYSLGLPWPLPWPLHNRQLHSSTDAPSSLLPLSPSILAAPSSPLTRRPSPPDMDSAQVVVTAQRFCCDHDTLHRPAEHRENSGGWWRKIRPSICSFFVLCIPHPAPGPPPPPPPMPVSGSST